MPDQAAVLRRRIPSIYCNPGLATPKRVTADVCNDDQSQFLSPRRRKRWAGKRFGPTVPLTALPQKTAIQSEKPSFPRASRRQHRLAIENAHKDAQCRAAEQNQPADRWANGPAGIQAPAAGSCLLPSLQSKKQDQRVLRRWPPIPNPPGRRGHGETGYSWDNIRRESPCWVKPSAQEAALRTDGKESRARENVDAVSLRIRRSGVPIPGSTHRHRSSETWRGSLQGEADSPHGILRSTAPP